MPKLRVIIKPPPEPQGDAEQQTEALRDYLLQMSEELAYVLTHLEADNINDSTFERIQGMIPRPYTGLPVMDGDASAGQSEQWARGDHRHGHDSTKADVTALEETADDLAAHIADKGNPHEVTKAQVGLDQVANERQYSALNPPPIPTPAQVGAIPATEKGSAGGVAELDSNGMVPSAQLPSYVDDVLNYPTLADFPAIGEDGKIYVAKDTNKQYRWSGIDYVQISESLALGETSSTAYRGDRGKIAYDHSQTTGNPHGTTAAEVGARPDDWMPTAAEVGARADTWMPTAADVGARPDTWTPSAADVGARPDSWVPDAEDVPYDNTQSGIMATDVQAAIDEIAQGGGGGGTAASAVSYDNTGSGLAATNVQDAIDEVYGDIPSQPSDIGAQEEIIASGILKGDGQGGVSAATAGTDYQAPLTIDATPTENSTNPVQSGGVYDALGTKLNKAAVSLNSSNDLDDIVEPGWYKCTTTPAHAPSGNFLNAWFEVVVNDSTILQFAYSNLDSSTGPTPKVRVRSNGAWGDWVSFDKNYPYAYQSQLAYVETGTTASRNYTAGQYISLNGLLYTAYTAIASGATFYTSGGNKNLTECVGGGLNAIRDHGIPIDDSASISVNTTYVDNYIASAMRFGTLCVVQLGLKMKAMSVPSGVTLVSDLPASVTDILIRFIGNDGSLLKAAITAGHTWIQKDETQTLNATWYNGTLVYFII